MLILQIDDKLSLVENLSEARIVVKAINFLDQSCFKGHEGLWQIVDHRDGKFIGWVKDPDIFRIFGKYQKELVDFYDENGKFSEELFRQHYKVA